MSKQQGYSAKEIEDRYYELCESRGYFEIDGNKKIQKKDKNFALMMPPPNVTGRLHIGHALTFTLQDIITRYKRMDGYKTLWQPGTDHAGIATQNIVERQLLEQGITKEQIGRDEFLKKSWEWKEYSGGQIVEQMRKLGVTPAWSRERFTMDDGLKEVVKQTFVKLYDDGMIIRDNYMVNWCTHDGALSDIEVEHSDIEGKFYHMRYYFENSDKFVVVATTRPETYFGDSAIMVHPDDDRYKDIIGKNVIVPLSTRSIKIIADDYVDMSLGTGVVKVTPAHDPNDYEVGKRHNLEFITVFDEKGILNSFAGDFEGIERLKARDSIVAKLSELNHIEKIEKHNHQVGHCYRCKNIVEPYISKQWFVKADIAKKSIQKTYKGETKFHPPHWINSYRAWMDNLNDWCISRQLWWGHRIPVFYCDDCNYEWADKSDEPSNCPKCDSKNFRQDSDVLDTWFSSAMWPFSTLGWGDNNSSKSTPSDLKDFYPNSLLITGFDILFFWVARMMMMGESFMKELPFKDIYLHALVRDESGAKMSKSKGNVIDPLDMVNEYSADIVRFTLAILAVQGRDIKLGQKHLELNRNFTNKLYNAAVYLQLNHNTFKDLDTLEIKSELGKYIKSRFNLAVKEIREALDSYRFNDGAKIAYRFIWNEFCDWGIELSKADKVSVAEIGSVFKESLKMLSPFMPFISEYLYHKLSGTSLEDNESIMINLYPSDISRDMRVESMFETIQESIISIRRAKVAIDLANQKIDKAYIKIDSDIDKVLATPFIQKLAKVKKIEFVDIKVENSISDISDNLEVYIPTDEIDLSSIISKLTKQSEKLEKEILKLGSMLSNERFIANAPAKVIRENTEALKLADEKLEKVKMELKYIQDSLLKK